MRAMDDSRVDRDWLEAFESWGESGSAARTYDGLPMPPRRLIEAVEHGFDRSDWCTWRGHPALYDYA